MASTGCSRSSGRVRLLQHLDGHVDVPALRLQGPDALAELGQGDGVLGRPAVADFIEVEDLADLGEGQAHPLAA